MKKFSLSAILIVVLTLLSCEDDMMDWQNLEDENPILVSELPLELREQLDRYEALNTYADFTVGIGLIRDYYMENELYRSLIHEYFDDVTVGYAMKHGAMVNSQGGINFAPIDEFIASVRQAGLDVYGHTLAWHANQNANYLNGIIAPEVIPGSSGPNSLDLSGLQDGSLNGWGENNPGAGISIEENEGLVDGTPALQMIASSSSFQPFDLQLASPNITVNSGSAYEVSFYIKSDETGRGRISFNNAVGNQFPFKDWYGEGDATEFFVTNSQWQEVKFTVDDIQDGATNLSFNFDLGYEPDVTYLIDVNTLSVVDLDAIGEPLNLISNGDFENGTLDGWYGFGNGSTRFVSEEGEGFPNSGFSMVLTNPTPAQSFEAQQVYEFNAPLEEGVQHTFSFNIRADQAASIQVQLQSPDFSGDYVSAIPVETNWTQITRTVTPGASDRDKFIFDFGEFANTYYIDNVVLTTGESGGGSEPILIEKSDEEKAEIIGEALEHWIVSMVTRYKDDVNAWDVVNEPMREGGTLRDGNVTDLASDDFYWVKYLGKDFAVTAFNLAREHANPEDKLFINDFNLESSLAKCQGLIEYVEYIESQGATVDGIGTQMHISLQTDKDNIQEMFRLLAASGKLIKVSELDVRLGTPTPTQQQLAEQADMYQFVADSFREIIPVSQQYGITLWNLSDHPDEHEFWLPDESPCLYDANYQRKHAYKGFANGLAGRDVSEDFTGDL